jgi:hypothetical protein
MQQNDYSMVFGQSDSVAYNIDMSALLFFQLVLNAVSCRTKIWI